MPASHRRRQYLIQRLETHITNTTKTMVRITRSGFLTRLLLITRCVPPVGTSRPVSRSGVWGLKIRRFGPYARWTTALLDILKQENVPATFFIIGKNGQAYPDLVRRIVNEGHEIGNHTYTHPNLGEIPLSLTGLELNATQRLIESLVGRSTVLFRPPYFGDAEADKPEEVEPAIRAKELGYLMIGVRIDPDDWRL